MQYVHIDFEVRSRLDLKKVGAYRWLSHPSSDVLCVAYQVDGVTKTIRGRGFGADYAEWEELYNIGQSDDYTFIAHNANFEYLVFELILHTKYGFPLQPFSKFLCSAASAAYHALPRDLAGAGKALGLDVVKDTKEGKAVMMKMAKLVHPKHQHLHGEWHESEEDFDTLIKYCEDDVRAEAAIFERLGPLPDAEQKVFELDHRINMRGLMIDVPLAEAAIELKQHVKEELEIECKAICGCKPTEISKIRPWLNETMDPPLDDLRAETVRLLLVGDTLTPTQRRVLQIRQEYSNTSLAKYDAAYSFEVDGVVRDQFMYYGATTGRWAGKGLQLQNLPRGVFAENNERPIELIKHRDIEAMESEFNLRATDIMKSCIRGLIIARPQHKLMVMDFSQIEARVLPWLAGQQDVLDMFERGEDLYKFTAAQIYDKPYDRITKDERFIGKTASLALGYGGGPVAFQGMAKNFGVHVPEDRADEIKKDWREGNEGVVQFWFDLEEAAIRAVQLGTMSTVNGMITFLKEGDFLTAKLPSGRKLYYYKPVVKMRKITPTWEKNSLSYTGSDSARGIYNGTVFTYGGKLAENVTQAVARDVLVEAMLRLDMTGYKIIGHVHDEIICEEEEGDSLEAMQSYVEEVPEWAAGLPIAADGFKTNRYYKG